MHNLLSRAQLNEWKHVEDTLDELALDEQRISDYYECLIECDALDQPRCKRVCKHILNER
jgi:hypothetical protein